MCPNHNVLDISTQSATPPYGPLTMFLPHSTYNVNYSPSSSLNMKNWTSKLWRLLKCHYLGQSLRLANKNQSFYFYWLCWRILYSRHNYRLSLNFKLFESYFNKRKFVHFDHMFATSVRLVSKSIHFAATLVAIQHVNIVANVHTCICNYNL